MLRVRDVACAGQLITLLSLLAGTLSVALAGNHCVAAAFAADTSAGNHQIDGRDTVVHTFRVVLDAARMQQKAGGSGSPHFGGANDHLWRNPSDLGGVFRRVLPY